MRVVKKQGGFTLVEIAIVLVVVGLLLGGVLKGQEMIASSRVKALSSDLNNMSTAIGSYQDVYRGLPGDELTATTHTDRGWGTIFSAGNKNGLIGAGTAADIFAVAASTEDIENSTAIRALRHAGHYKGDATKGLDLPVNAAGGSIALTNDVMGLGLNNVVCLNKVTGKLAGALDRLIDDGQIHTGRIRSVAGAGKLVQTAPASAPAYVADDSHYIVCSPV